MRTSGHGGGEQKRVGFALALLGLVLALLGTATVARAPADAPGAAAMRQSG